LAAGIINGVGSAGQLLSPLAVAFVSQKYGWNALFQLFVIFALIAALLLIVKWNYGAENQEDELTDLLSPKSGEFPQLEVINNL